MTRLRRLALAGTVAMIGAVTLGPARAATASRAPSTIPKAGAPVDMKQVSAALNRITAARAAELKIRTGKAACPAKVVAKPDTVTTFQCTVPYEGVLAPYLVSIDPVKGTFDIRPAEAILATALLTKFVTSSLDPPVRGATADCGDGKVVLAAVGSIVPCTVRQGGRTGTVRVKVTDVEGTVTIVA